MSGPRNHTPAAVDLGPPTPNPPPKTHQAKPHNPKPSKQSPTKLNPTNKTTKWGPPMWNPSQQWVYEPHLSQLQPAPMPIRPQSPNLANKTAVSNDLTNGMPVDEYHMRTTPTAAVAQKECREPLFLCYCG
ncbi:hypothetical protein BS47DRAFT_1363206 [Hydnum rufescens UP504]|uniref:Uncharacterized protein n=1 Tax=Hydnum rufescens UP504 TaxID=1448309 RepID=A0A9P6DSR2_9AGAM|nr:hypothetical protein BS47DRAFT_1363206 [Hydnum rufescens UP504]